SSTRVITSSIKGRITSHHWETTSLITGRSITAPITGDHTTESPHRADHQSNTGRITSPSLGGSPVHHWEDHHTEASLLPLTKPLTKRSSHTDRGSKAESELPPRHDHASLV
ncbi:unnamed protein product, partial [Pleuronectes platessa]